MTRKQETLAVLRREILRLKQQIRSLKKAAPILALCLLALPSKAQAPSGTTLETGSANCGYTNMICGNIPSVPAGYTISYHQADVSNNFHGMVSISNAEGLVLAANDFVLERSMLTAPESVPCSCLSETIQHTTLTGQFEFVNGTPQGSFSINFDYITRRQGAGRYIQTSHYFVTHTDEGGVSGTATF